MISTITDQQRVAIMTDGLCVLSACPGSGKTFVVAKRIEHILQSKPLKKYQGILALSFTNTAQQEILKGYYELTGRHLDNPHFVGTIDSFLNQRVFLPLGHKIMKSKKAIVLNPHCNDYLLKLFPGLAQILGEVEYKPDGNLICPTTKDDTKRYAKYAKQEMKKCGLATQSDVNYWSMKILEEYPQITANIVKRFPYLIIDEAQDCSAIQMRIIDILKGQGMSQIMLVGDPYQSIYEFRNAEPSLFIEKAQDPEWQHLDLTQSFRSGRNICSLISSLHPEKNITPNPEIVDDAVEFKNGTTKELIDSFVQATQSKGVPIEKEKVAILYSSHSSDVSSRKASEDEIKGVFASDNRDFYYLPLRAAIALASNQKAEAVLFLEKLFYYLIYGVFLGSESAMQASMLSTIRNKVRIRKFAQNLPSLSLKLDEWAEQVNKLIIGECTFFGVNTKNITPLKKRNSEQKELLQSPLETIFLKQPLTTHDILVTNIHQIKGRTFEAVMLYLEPGRSKDMSVGKILDMYQSLQKQGSDIFFKTGRNAEKYRCYYVAISRPKRLLWIVSPDQKVLDLAQLVILNHTRRHVVG